VLYPARCGKKPKCNEPGEYSPPYFFVLDFSSKEARNRRGLFRKSVWISKTPSPSTFALSPILSSTACEQVTATTSPLSFMKVARLYAICCPCALVNVFALALSTRILLVKCILIYVRRLGVPLWSF